LAGVDTVIGGQAELGRGAGPGPVIGELMKLPIGQYGLFDELPF
jgi:hypothetical protein